MMKKISMVIFFIASIRGYDTTPNFQYGSVFAYRCSYVATDTYSEYTTCVQKNSSTNNFKIARKEGANVEHMAGPFLDYGDANN